MPSLPILILVRVVLLPHVDLNLDNVGRALKPPRYINKEGQLARLDRE